jgi:hypothetical protein
MQQTTTYQATTVTVDWTLPLLMGGCALFALAVVGLVVVLELSRRKSTKA